MSMSKSVGSRSWMLGKQEGAGNWAIVCRAALGVVELMPWWVFTADTVPCWILTVESWGGSWDIPERIIPNSICEWRWWCCCCGCCWCGWWWMWCCCGCIWACSAIGATVLGSSPLLRSSWLGLDLTPKPIRPTPPELAMMGSTWVIRTSVGGGESDVSSASRLEGTWVLYCPVPREPELDIGLKRELLKVDGSLLLEPHWETEAWVPLWAGACWRLDGCSWWKEEKLEPRGSKVEAEGSGVGGAGGAVLGLAPPWGPVINVRPSIRSSSSMRVSVSVGVKLLPAYLPSSPSSGKLSSSSCPGAMGDRRPLSVLALELVRGRKVVHMSLSSMLPRDEGLLLLTHLGNCCEELGLSAPAEPALPSPGSAPLLDPRPAAPACFFVCLALMRLFSSLLLLSMEAARRRGAFPVLPPSGLSIHQELLPVDSLWTLKNLLWSDRLWRMEFWKQKRNRRQGNSDGYAG